MESKTTEQKIEWLKAEIKSLESVLVAFSGGVDSTYLLKICHDTLSKTKGRALGVTARSSTYPEREMNEAIELVRIIGAEHRIIESEELDIEGYAKNPVNRCYYCKGELFGKLTDIAKAEGIAVVLDGSNADDLSDHRPGSKAAKEQSVRSLLQEAGLTKEEIRTHSHELELPTWDKPAFACLASRFPYGENITADKLKMVDASEQYLRDMGFGQHRVRHHGDVARIELSSGEVSRAVQPEMAKQIYDKLKQIGFAFVSIDLVGYRTGSMNETLPKTTNAHS